MSKEFKNTGCCCSPGCCGEIKKPEANKKRITIDFLYLDF